MWQSCRQRSVAAGDPMFWLRSSSLIFVCAVQCMRIFQARTPAHMHETITFVRLNCPAHTNTLVHSSFFDCQQKDLQTPSTPSGPLSPGKSGRISANFLLRQYELRVCPMIVAAGTEGISAGAIARKLLSNMVYTEHPGFDPTQRPGVATKMVISCHSQHAGLWQL